MTISSIKDIFLKIENTVVSKLLNRRDLHYSDYKYKDLLERVTKLNNDVSEFSNIDIVQQLIVQLLEDCRDFRNDFEINSLLSKLRNEVYKPSRD